MILPAIQLIDVDLRRDDHKTVRAPQPLVHEAVMRCERFGVTLPDKTPNTVLGDLPIELPDAAAQCLFVDLPREAKVAEITVQQVIIAKLGYVHPRTTRKQREVVSGVFLNKFHG